MLLPQRQPVIVPGRKIADIKPRDREPRDLGYLPFREEPVDDAALIENLERACAQTAGTRTGKLLVGSPFDNGDIDACQGQFACQHQARRPCPRNHDCMFPIANSLISIAPTQYLRFQRPGPIAFSPSNRPVQSVLRRYRFSLSQVVLPINISSILVGRTCDRISGLLSKALFTATCGSLAVEPKLFNTT